MDPILSDEDTNFIETLFFKNKQITKKSSTIDPILSDEDTNFIETPDTTYLLYIGIGGRYRLPFASTWIYHQFLLGSVLHIFLVFCVVWLVFYILVLCLECLRIVNF